MIKVYLFLIIMGVLGVVGYGGYMYYKDTQQRIATLTENNAKLEVAVQISEDSVELLQDDIEKNAELNRELQKELQVAEKYGDQLRNTLRKHNLTHLANITNPDGVQSDARTKGSDGNKDSKNGSSDSSKTKASSTK